MDLRVSKWTDQGKFNHNDIVNDFKDIENFNTQAESKEKERLANETTRENNESLRVAAETNRVNTFNANQLDRENKYKTSESNRDILYSQAESQRNSMFNTEEDKRAAAESIRVTNENTRISKEAERITNESNRVKNETNRVDKEKIRESNESTRVDNENVRMSSESTRVSSENTRISNENIRKSNESVRQSNENLRINNEAKRVSEFNGIKTEYGTLKGIMIDENNAVNLQNQITKIADNAIKEVVETANVISVSDSVDGMMNIEIGGRTLKNELSYNSNTWAEWTKSTGVVGDSTGLEFTANGINYQTASIKTNLKQSTKYGFILNCISNTLTISQATYSGLYLGNISNGTILAPKGFIGNVKCVITSGTENLSPLYISILNTEPAGNKIKIKDIRIYELPAGSEIENDFNTLSADELAVKYPFASGISSVGEAEGNKIEVLTTNDVLFGSEYIKASTFYKVFLPKNTWVVASYDDNTIAYQILYYDASLNQLDYWTLTDTLNGRRYRRFITKADNDAYYVKVNANVKNFQIVLYSNDIIKDVKYVYKEDKINNLLSAPLNGLPNGVRDVVSGDTVERKVRKDVLDGSESWNVDIGQSNDTTLLFFKNISNCTVKNNDILADKLNVIDVNTLYNATNTTEGISKNGLGVVRIRILKSKLITPDLAGFKAWLAQNPTTVYYELSEPTIEKLPQPLTLQSFKSGTLQVNTAIPPVVTVKYPSNISSRISTIEEVNNTMLDSLGGAWRTLLILADKELAMKSIQPLTTTDDISKKVNNILEVWK